jgi:NAD(P)-dependent dehydrogenase (short-subunit alcohol dehydrogenase family)
MTQTTEAILKGKSAVVFGAGGTVGAAVARELAAEGAQVFLVGRTRSTIDDVATSIVASGGRAHGAALDALDDRAVNEYFDAVARQAGRIDIEFNATGPRAAEYGNGKPALEVPIDEFMVPVMTVLKSQFITARAAARHMVKQRSGVIIFLTGSPSRGHVAGATAIGSAFGAIETLMENMAFELGPAGVRAVCLRTTANVDSRTMLDTMDSIGRATHATRDQMIAGMASFNFLKSPATVRDTARGAVLVASDQARMMTGTVVNCTAGAAMD